MLHIHQIVGSSAPDIHDYRVYDYYSLRTDLDLLRLVSFVIPIEDDELVIPAINSRTKRKRERNSIHTRDQPAVKKTE